MAVEIVDISHQCEQVNEIFILLNSVVSEAMWVITVCYMSDTLDGILSLMLPGLLFDT